MMSEKIKLVMVKRNMVGKDLADALGKRKNILIDTESLYNNDEFRHILGYINTSGTVQKKGATGHVK